MTTGTFTVEVGRWIAGRVERELRRGAFEIGVELDIEKHMGWMDGVLLVTVSGESDKVVEFLSRMHRWQRQIDMEGL